MSKFRLPTIVLLFVSNSSFAFRDCSQKAGEYLRGIGEPRQTRLVAINHGYLIYHIRTNWYGGDAEYEVVTTSDCKYVSHKLRWSE